MQHGAHVLVRTAVRDVRRPDNRSVCPHRVLSFSDCRSKSDLAKAGRQQFQFKLLAAEVSLLTALWRSVSHPGLFYARNASGAILPLWLIGLKVLHAVASSGCFRVLLFGPSVLSPWLPSVFRSAHCRPGVMTTPLLQQQRQRGGSVAGAG